MSQSAASSERTLKSLSSEQTRLFELLLERRNAARTITAQPRETSGGRVRLPMSWAQQRLWFIDQLEGGGSAYNIQLALRMRGALDVDALHVAFRRIVSRHEALRTIFVSTEDGPQQEILSESRFELRSVDLSGQDEPARDETLHSHRLDEWQQQFDLKVGPLIRGRLLRLTPEEHVLLITIHHIISDGWSVAVLLRELRELYSAHIENRAAALPSLSIQYADYAQWQRNWLQGSTLEKQLNYWRSQLEGAAPELELPLDRPRPAVHGYRGKSLKVHLDADLTAELNAFARRHGITLFMALHAAWAILLSRLSGQHDIVIGTPVANRARPELENLIGFFVNTLALRLEVDGNISLAEFVQRVKRMALGAYQHQDIPFEQIVEWLKPHRSLNRHPIFQVMFALQSAPQAKLELPQLKATLEDSVNEASKFDLLLALEERDRHIVGTLNFDSELFDQSTVERWIACFKVLLKSIPSGDSTCLDRLPILPQDERHRVIEEFNGSYESSSAGQLIHQLFETQVARDPQAIAVTFEDQQLSYGELNRKANQLARHLRDRGVATGDLVGICVERGPDMVVGLLGILKAGGAYVPLDPSYPAERLHYMLEDARLRVMLVQSQVRGHLPEASTQVITLDEDWDEIAKQPGGDLDQRALALSPRHLAYVIYTSGSTGRPKGVMVEHRNVTRLFSSTHHWYGFDRHDVWTLFHSYAFDFSVWELWGALLYGGRVVVVPRLTARSPQDFYRLLCAEGVTVLNQTPSAFVQLIDAQARSQELAHSLRLVIFGGEALELRTLRPWIRRNSATRTQLVNMYGITETTVHVTYRPPLTEEQIESGRRNLIGKPIVDLRAYLLDRHGQPVPVGVTGEIHVGGAGVARGYLNRPELSAQRFPADPFSPEAGARMYKSGDLGRWRADGTIEYLGRNDHQVKIRGFRIELGEIEAQLAKHEAVKEATVLAREDVPGDKRLVGYVVPKDPDQTPNVDSLRTHMKAAVPEHMVPSAFMIIDHLPLTPNGKLDTRALPAPGYEAFATRTYEPPQGEIEELLAGVWRTLLRVERIGRQDNFFELGGHSLLIVQMMERLRAVGLHVNVRRIFESATLADLASAVAGEVATDSEVPPNLIPAGAQLITPQMLTLVQLEPEHIDEIAQAVPGGASNIQDIYPLTPLQEGILFHHLLSGQTGDLYVIPVLLSVVSRQRLDQLIEALQHAIDRHDVLRTAVMWEKLPRAVQVVHRRSQLLVEQIDLEPGRDALEQVTEWMRPEQQVLDLKCAPLVRLRIAPGPDGLWYALLRFHHIVDDATSMKMLIAEIVGRLEGRVAQPVESVPYRAHVATALNHAKLREAETFFQAKLGGIEEPTAPFGLTDVHGKSTQIRDARVALPPLLVQRVHAQARRAGVSAATVFHAAWSLVVASTSGRQDVVFGTVLLGRMHGAGISQTMGMFINTLPLRLQLQNICAKELVQQTQRALIELMSHEYAPLFVAQRCSGIVGSAPLFTALLNYRHNVGAADARWSAAAGIQVVAKSERTNYPITLSIDDLGDGFLLTAHTDYRIDPSRVVEYLSVAVDSLTAALEQTPDTAALALSVLPQSERHLVLQAFNATQAPRTPETLVHSMFEQQAGLTPEATAIMHGERSFTYGELNAKANQLARLLETRGVRSGHCVAVCLERGYDMVVALLAALKAGACYLPLDPNYPADRLDYMLADAAPRILITQAKLESLLPAGVVDLVVIDEEQQNIASYSEADASRAAEALEGADPLYVIYTSGSTGKPKGTQMPHRAMVNLLQWHQRCLPSATGQRVLQFAALSFDVAFQEIFSTLCTGGTLVLIDESLRRDPVALLEVINGASVQRLFLPPLMLQSLAETCSVAGAPMSLRQIVTAGEQLRVTPEVVELCEQLHGCELHNHYGPTETHVVTSLTLSGDPRAWPSLPCIGKPIDNTQIYILDTAQLPVPIGIAGEIYIGGANLAQGYLNRPELTAERFIRDPFSDDPGSRLYRTGDLGKWREDGAIEYLGRNDQQVKIRGYRIELGEVETQLARLPDIKEVAVIAREDTPGQKRLVAYVTQDENGEALRPEKLRTALKAVLPEYMVPNAFVILDRMPVTPSGKLDRRSLPLPGGVALEAHYEAPEGAIESALATIWQELLHIEAVGRNDNFFDLGTHSILVLKALSMINKRFSCALRIQEIYANPTIRELAQRISGAEAQEEYVDLMQESALDEDIAPGAGQPCIPPRTVLLTGATGFVGRYLLAQLLRDTSATVYCLVRAESYGAARARLKQGLTVCELWRPEYESRMITVHGDLRQPHLGIEAATYEMLSKTVDSIYHCATSMNHLETYSMAKRANVDAVRTLVRFAVQSRPKLINYISTLGVFGGTEPRVVDEDSSIDRERHKKASGYVASKWVAEKIIMRASERGFHCKIFRVGLAWADSVRGHYDEAQREHRVLKSSLQMGTGIKDYRYGMAPTPVDFIARAIVLLSNKLAEPLQVFHVASDAPVARPFERLNMSGAVRLTLVPFYEWTREVQRRYEQGEALPIVPLIEHLFSLDAQRFDEYQQRVRSEGVIHSCEKTYEELRNMGLAPPAVDDAMLVAAARRIIRNEPEMEIDCMSHGAVEESENPRLSDQVLH